MSMNASSGDQNLLAEQIDYYRAVAGEYFDGRLDEGGGDELVTVIDEFAPTGDVLELACGPGTWTPQLLRRADTVTAVDASPEMQALAKQRIAADLDRVRFVLADLFTWEPDRHRGSDVSNHPAPAARRNAASSSEGAPHSGRTSARAHRTRVDHPGPGVSDQRCNRR